MNDQNNPDFKALNLGAKLTCGFEILANTKTHQDDLKQSYIQSLTNKGYFQSELKGSKKYNGLLAEAEKHLLQNSSGKYIKLSPKVHSFLKHCLHDLHFMKTRSFSPKPFQASPS